jgi:hypothetical protein
MFVALVPGQSDQNREVEFRWMDIPLHHFEEKTRSLPCDFRPNLWYHSLARPFCCDVGFDI